MIRHVIKLYVLISISFIYSSENIKISLDPISHNTFYLDSVCPIYQPDSFYGGYMVEGNLGYAMSVYLINNLYTNINDSVRTNSSFSYKQGDVGYRDFTFDVKTKVSKGGIVKLIGNGMSYPGRISQYYNGNILQNYLLQFSKNFSSSKLSFYSGYHIENKEVRYINSNSGESYLAGINYNIFKDKYQIDLKYAFQIGQANFSELTHYDITWTLLNSKYYLTKNITPYINNLYKTLYFDGEEYDINKLFTGIQFNSNLIEFYIAAHSVDSNLYPEIAFKTKFNNINAMGGFLNKSWFDTKQYSINIWMTDIQTGVEVFRFRESYKKDFILK